jgi:hypothetical protein
MTINIEKTQIANGFNRGGFAKLTVWAVTRNGMTMNAIQHGSKAVADASTYNGIYLTTEAAARQFAAELAA